MKKMPAGKFKAHCLTIMEEVRATREPVLITKRGRPVAKLVPPDTSSDDFIGRLEGVTSGANGGTALKKRANAAEVVLLLLSASLKFHPN